MLLRPALPDDGEVLADALALAADWRSGTVVRTVADVLADPALARYLAGWPGLRDRGVVATVDATAVGAAWWRFLAADDPGYGFVSTDVPEVSVGVRHAHRGRGVGTARCARSSTRGPGTDWRG